MAYNSNFEEGLKSPKEVGILIINLDDDNIPEIEKKADLFENLIGLRLESNKKNIDILPTQMLRKVSVLSIEFKHAIKIPNRIFKLKQLEFLAIEGDEIIETPREIWRLKKLKIFQVFGKKIEIISDGIGALKKLEFLRIYSDEIKILPIDIGGCRLLKSIDIFSKSEFELPKSIINCEELKEFRWGNCKARCLKSSVLKNKKGVGWKKSLTSSEHTLTNRAEK